MIALCRSPYWGLRIFWTNTFTPDFYIIGFGLPYEEVGRMEQKNNNL